GGAGLGEEDSANGCRGAVICGLGWSSLGQCAAVCARGKCCCRRRHHVFYSESEGDNADAIEHDCVEAHLDMDQEALIQDRTESADGGSGWTKRSAG
uniref:Uncharacterized protein n=3 Tax=Aegilops tauschii subsp. strangulata TaxID=200361 RepID=A0A453K5E7_AEGTS